jgi:hypothetical protein
VPDHAAGERRSLLEPSCARQKRRRVDMCKYGVGWTALALARSIHGSPTLSVSFHLCCLRSVHSTSPLEATLCLIPALTPVQPGRKKRIIGDNSSPKQDAYSVLDVEAADEDRRAEESESRHVPTICAPISFSRAYAVTAYAYSEDVSDRLPPGRHGDDCSEPETEQPPRVCHRLLVADSGWNVSLQLPSAGTVMVLTAVAAQSRMLKLCSTVHT